MRRFDSVAIALLTVLSACAAPAPRPLEIERSAAGLTALLHHQPLRWTGRAPVSRVARAGVLIAASSNASQPEWELPSATASAERMAQALVAHCGVAPRALTQLVGAEVHRDAVSAAIGRAADALSGANATLFLYYAGHGFVDATGDPLLFGHFTLAEPGGGFSAGIGRRDLVRAVSDARQRAAARGVALQVIMIVDACRVGLLSPAPKATLAEAPLWELWSTRAGTYARAGSGNAVFVFTAALADAMDALAQTALEVDLRRLAAEARARTLQLTAGAQEPELLAPRLGAEPPTAVLSAGVTFRVVLSDAISSVRLPGFSVRVGQRTFLADANGEALVEALPGVQSIEIDAPDYLTRRDEVDLGVERTGGMLEASVYPALALVSGRVSPPGVFMVRAVGGRSLPRDNYHLVRTVSGRDGMFQLRVPSLTDGMELEVVVGERVVHTMPLPRATATSVSIQGSPAVPRVDVAVQLDAATDMLVIDGAQEPGQPLDLPRPRQPHASSDLERVRDLLRASRYEMARDALSVADVTAADEPLRQQWLHWLELRAARGQAPATVSKRLVELAARGAPESLRSALAEALLQRLVDARAWDQVADLFETCAAKKVVASASWQRLERRSLPIAMEYVLRGALAHGVQTGDWQRADRASTWLLAAEHLWVVQERPALAELRQEIERERVAPACRQAFERANIALAEGRSDDASALFASARIEANEHYRQLIDERLQHLDARVYEDAMGAGTQHELAGRSTEALRAYAKAYNKDRRAAESLRRVLRAGVVADASFSRTYERLLDEAIERTQSAGHASAWGEVMQFFADEPRARAALLAALVTPWADVVDDNVGPSGLPCAVRERRSGVVLRLVEAGSFWMGADDADRQATAVERPRHMVTLTRPFWLGETEVTWEQWRPFAAETGLGGGLEASSARHPVASLTWSLAEQYCTHFGFRLPTEAEWEYAARTGDSDPYRRYDWGDDPRGAVGNFYGQDEARPGEDVFPVRDGFVGLSPASAYPANRWGFFDMLGNVREWCADSFAHAAYRERTQGVVDPKVEGAPDATAVVRGGSYQDGPRNAGLATRLEAAHDARLPWVGLRVARDVF